MNTRLLFSTILIFSAFGALKGQNYTDIRNFYEEFRKNQYERSFSEKSDILGSPCENAAFISGDVYVNRNQHYTDIPLRYNIYTNQIQFRKPTGEIFEISPPEIIDSVFIGKSRYTYYSYQSGSKTQKSFFKVLTSGNPTLLLKMNIVLKEAEKPGAYKDAVPASFERMQDDFYLADNTGDAIKFSGKKDFLEILPSHKTESEQFIKQNKTKFNRQEDVIKLMEFYYSLK
jgi:hypothetical protein